MQPSKFFSSNNFGMFHVLYDFWPTWWLQMVFHCVGINCKKWICPGVGVHNYPVAKYTWFLKPYPELRKDVSSDSTLTNPLFALMWDTVPLTKVSKWWEDIVHWHFIKEEKKYSWSVLSYIQWLDVCQQLYVSLLCKLYILLG